MVVTVESVLNYARESSQRLENLVNAGEKITALESAEQELLFQLGRQGMTLSQYRKQAAMTLCSQVERQLNDLNMSGARFEVDFKYQPRKSGLTLEDGTCVSFDENGIDQVEFLIAPNSWGGI